MAPPRKARITRWIAVVLLFVFGMLLVLGGVLVPAHFRALDVAVMQEAGRNSTNLVDLGRQALTQTHYAMARLLLQAAQGSETPGAEDPHLARFLNDMATWQAQQQGISELDLIVRQDPWARQWDGRPIMQVLAAREARDTLRQYLQGAYRSGILEILKTRQFEQLTYFAPADSASGQPYESACLLAGLLVQTESLPESLRSDLESLAYGATRKGDVTPLELVYLDLVSLGNRMNWGQLVGVLERVPNVGTLRDLTNLFRHVGEDWAVLAGAVVLHGAGQAVTQYLMGHAGTGLPDLKRSLGSGQGGLAILLKVGLRLYEPNWRRSLVQGPPLQIVFYTWVRVAVASHGLALLLRFGLLFLGTFFLARAGIDIMPMAEGIAIKRWGSPAHLVFFGGLFILLAALFEPFIFQQSQNLNFPLHWKFPMLGEEIRQTISNQLKPMNESVLTIIALVFFLVLQGVVYVTCLLKLAEIRRQPVSSRIKLKLLENEENMFDAGLYCGLGGTVASLVLLAMGVLKPSLMAAYASTLFGIIFVAVLKIFHLRPFRRRLIMDSESDFE